MPAASRHTRRTRTATAARALGAQGEELAVAYLVDRGLVVLDRNWRCRYGELDIVATDTRQLIVCEVKTRSNADYGSPAESLSVDKAHRVRSLARSWLSAHRVGWCRIRCDLMAILWPVGSTPIIDYRPGAF